MYFQIFLQRMRLMLPDGRLSVLPLVLLIIFFSSLFFYFFERDLHENLSYFDALWWSVVTMTTVGYGDLYPQTMAGRFLVGLPTMLLGIAILAIVLERVQTNITQSSKKMRGIIAMEEKNHIIILGYPGDQQLNEIVKEIRLDDRLGTMPIGFLTDRIEENPQELENLKVSFIRGNPIQSQALLKANISEAVKVIVMADDVSNSDSDGITLMRILNARKLMKHPEAVLIAQCLNRENEATMYTAGSDEVIVLESLTAGLIVQGVSALGLNPILRTLLTNERGFQFYIERVPENIQNKTLGAVCETVEKCWKNVRTVGILDAQRQLQMSDQFTLNPGHQILYISDHMQDFSTLDMS